jgi:hypothetical protein
MGGIDTNRWKRFASGVVTIAMVAGCGGSQRTSTAPDRPRPTRAKIIADMRGALVMPTCRGDTEGLRACGLLAVEWAQPSFIQSFKAAQCPDGIDDPCREKLRAAFVDALAKRYAAASLHDVEARCMAETDCGPFDLYELKWLESNNARVIGATQRTLVELAEREAREERLDRERAAADEARVRAIGGAFQGMSDWARTHREGGCVNSYSCAPGFTCVLAGGQTTGTCLKAN